MNGKNDMNSRVGFDANTGWGFESKYTGFESAPAISLNTYIARTFIWMAAGLGLTFAVALFMYSSGIAFRMLYGAGSAALIVAAVAQIGVVLFLSFRIGKMSVGAARFCFFLYAGLTGITFSFYFIGFDLAILIYAFLATAAFFGGMAAVTLLFHLDLSRIRNFLFGGLIFLIFIGLVGVIFRLEALQILECWLGIALFIGYTAYDTQMIVRNYQYYSGNSVMLQKASIFSALQLYLDFINLLIRIIQIFGGNSRKS